MYENHRRDEDYRYGERQRKIRRKRIQREKRRRGVNRDQHECAGMSVSDEPASVSTDEDQVQVRSTMKAQVPFLDVSVSIGLWNPPVREEPTWLRRHWKYGKSTERHNESKWHIDPKIWCDHPTTGTLGRYQQKRNYREHLRGEEIRSRTLHKVM